MLKNIKKGKNYIICEMMFIKFDLIVKTLALRVPLSIIFWGQSWGYVYIIFISSLCIFSYLNIRHNRFIIADLREGEGGLFYVFFL